MTRSQNNDLVQSAIWDIRYADATGNCVEAFYFNSYFNGDTVINGNQYFKLYERGVNKSEPKGSSSQSCTHADIYYNNFKGLVRYWQKKLIVWQNQDKIFIDYNKNIGDSLLQTNTVSYGGLSNNKMKITSIDSVLINGIYLKRFFYTSHELNSDYTRYIIEKIGSFNGFIDNYTDGFEYFSNLYCYSENNVTVYTDPTTTYPCVLNVGVNEYDYSKNIVISPNPTSGALRINIKGEENSVQKIVITNSLGKVVFEEFKPKTSLNYDLSFLNSGVYFIECKTLYGNIVKKIIKE